MIVTAAATAAGTNGSAYWGAPAGRRAEILSSFWRNGEGWYRLRDLRTGETFESPDIFWYEEEVS